MFVWAVHSFCLCFWYEHTCIMDRLMWRPDLISSKVSFGKKKKNATFCDLICLGWRGPVVLHPCGKLRSLLTRRMTVCSAIFSSGAFLCRYIWTKLWTDWYFIEFDSERCCIVPLCKGDWIGMHKNGLWEYFLLKVDNTLAM